MKRSDFLNMIESTGPGDRHSVGEVTELISIFPYFQSAYNLLLRGLQNTADVKFENQLRISAMHIANREVLYYFLKKEEIVKAENIPAGNTIEKESSTESEQTVIESGKSSTDLINEIEKAEGEVEANDPPKEHTVIVSEENGYDDSNATILLIDEESGELDERITYMDPGFSIPEKSDLLELDTSSHFSTPDSSQETEDENPVPQVPASVKDLQTLLINKFIDANPRIEPQREKSDKPVEDISKPFADMAEGLVTETLARIYIGQQYYSKAINIYEKLSLKYPEKSSYFASQIEKVKELIKK